MTAELIGRSAEWLRQVENGHRSLDSLEIIRRLVDVLRVGSVADFIADGATEHSGFGRSAVETARLRRAVIGHPWLRTRTAPAVPDPAVELATCWRLWSESPTRYSDVTPRLPAILEHCQEVHGDRSADPGWSILLMDSYELARSLLNRTGDHDVARLAADRAMQIGSRLGDPVTMGISAWHLGRAYLHLDKVRPALDFAVTAAERVTTAGLDEWTASWLRGALYLLAAEASATGHDSDAAARYLALAKRDNTALEADHGDRGVWCGPTEFGICQIHVLLRLGRVDEALRLSGELELPNGHPVERTARYFVALAHAYTVRGNDVAAVFALTKVEDGCPEDIRFDALARRTVLRLLRRHNRTVAPELARLTALHAANTRVGGSANSRPGTHGHNGGASRANDGWRQGDQVL